MLLPPNADHWWKVVALLWNGEGSNGVAELEPAEPPPDLPELATS